MYYFSLSTPHNHKKCNELLCYHHTFYNELSYYRHTFYSELCNLPTLPTLRFLTYSPYSHNARHTPYQFTTSPHKQNTPEQFRPRVSIDSFYITLALATVNQLPAVKHFSLAVNQQPTFSQTAKQPIKQLQTNTAV
mgnify:CR=1 FL=1